MLLVVNSKDRVDGEFFIKYISGREFSKKSNPDGSLGACGLEVLILFFEIGLLFFAFQLMVRIHTLCDWRN